MAKIDHWRMDLETLRPQFQHQFDESRFDLDAVIFPADDATRIYSPAKMDINSTDQENAWRRFDNLAADASQLIVDQKKTARAVGINDTTINEPNHKKRWCLALFDVCGVNPDAEVDVIGLREIVITDVFQKSVRVLNKLAMMSERPRDLKEGSAVQRAWENHQWAIERTDAKTERQVWDYLREHIDDCPHTPGRCATFLRYVRDARDQLEVPKKNMPRRGRTGRSIITGSESG